MRRTGPEFLQNNGDVSPIVDLRIETTGVSCEEYTLLIIAGPNSNDLPSEIRERMNRHLKVCRYHNSSGFVQSALGAPVTSELEKAALEVIGKYMNSTSKQVG